MDFRENQAIQELLKALHKTERASVFIQQGIEQFNNGDFESALTSFENAFEVSPENIPNLLYYSLCYWSLIYNIDVSDRSLPVAPKIRRYLQEMKSKLENAIEGIEAILNFEIR